MHHFTSDFLFIITSCHRKPHSRHRHACFLVDFFSVPFPSPAPNVPLKPGRRISPISHTLHLYFTARSGHKRTSKWWRFSWDSQVDRSWRGWKYYSWVIRFLQNCPIFNFLSGDGDFVRRIKTFDHGFLLAQYLHWKWWSCWENKRQGGIAISIKPDLQFLIYLMSNFWNFNICIIELSTPFN